MAEVKSGKVEKDRKARVAKPSWIKIKKEEFEKIVVDLAKEGKTLAQIGLILRDKHGVPKAKLFGRRIKEILEEKEVGYRDEKDILDSRNARLKEHIAKNKHDYPASRALTKKLWAVRRLKN